MIKMASRRVMSCHAPTSEQDSKPELPVTHTRLSFLTTPPTHTHTHTHTGVDYLSFRHTGHELFRIGCIRDKDFLERSSSNIRTFLLLSVNISCPVSPINNVLSLEMQRNLTASCFIVAPQSF